MYKDGRHGVVVCVYIPWYVLESEEVKVVNQSIVYSP